MKIRQLSEVSSRQTSRWTNRQTDRQTDGYSKNITVANLNWRR